MNLQSPPNVEQAYHRIKNYLYNTPILSSTILNDALKANIYFKLDALQKTGAFKVRGVLNHLLALQQQDSLPAKVVAFSTGNHGIGLAWVAKLLNIKARIYLPQNTAPIKHQAAASYGAEVIKTTTRQEAEIRALADADHGFYYLHPSDSNLTIAGSATLCYEALMSLPLKPDAIFAACGGGGLLAGSYLAKNLLSPSSQLIACEPEAANDAYLSWHQGLIYKFTTPPNTIADGLRSLAISERTFSYLRQVDQFFLATEQEIHYWTAWLTHLLKITCEPSCALTMAGVTSWLKQSQKDRPSILVLISGGNIDSSLYGNFGQYLTIPPSINPDFS